MQDPIKLSIDGLDPESCALLDIMWVMDSQEELELWKHCLPTTQKQKVETLCEMLKLSVIDVEIGKMDNQTFIAKELLEELGINTT